MKDCVAISPEGIPCRLSVNNHPKHVSGFGKAMITWVNEDYLPAPPPMSKRRMAEIARSIRDSSVLCPPTPTKG